MLLESHLGDGLVLFIDVENQGGVDKNAVGSGAHPDMIVDNAIILIQAAAERMGAGLSMQGPVAPVTMEVEFGVRVDANAVVALARCPEEGHFRVKLRWDG